MHLRGVGNGGEGHCAFEVAGQAFAVGEGWPIDLVERAFVAGDNKHLFRLHTALRLLTIAVFNVSENPMVTEDMEGPQTARGEDGIRRMALNFRQHITNPVDFRDAVLYMDPVGGGGGHGGTRAILALSEGLGIDLPMGRKLDVQTEYVNGSTRKCMALHDEVKGHWSLVIVNVS